MFVSKGFSDVPYLGICLECQYGKRYVRLSGLVEEEEDIWKAWDRGDGVEKK